MALQLLCSRDCPVWTNGKPGEQCVAQLKLRRVLKDIFHHDSFRPGQLEAVLPAAHGKDAFVRMPTGGGKTLCMFLVPLSISEAMGIVISPLVGLMEQQVTQLSSVGVTAIHGYTSQHIKDVKAGKFRFVFISPETAQLAEWRALFTELKGKIALVAVDEAHCISEWGTNFRRAFKEVGGLRALIDAPFMALTASAPPTVESEIISSLYLDKPVVVSCDLNRRNIFVSASPIRSLDRDFYGLANMLKSPNSFIIPKIIIYVQTKDMAWRVYSHMHREAAKPCYVGVYHADLTPATKSTVYQDFRSSSSSLKCLIATVAFGMGMDIPDVEVVVVYGTPTTTSQLYQLFGRAGRLGMPSRAHLFYSTKKKVNTELESFIAYKCRRRSLLFSIGGVVDGRDCEYGCCDVCGDTLSARLNILSSAVVKRKVRRVQRTVSPNLESRLVAARKEVFAEHPSFQMVGINFLCPDSTIKKLCNEAKFISSIQDFPAEIRAELREKFFSAIMSGSSTS